MFLCLSVCKYIEHAACTPDWALRVMLVLLLSPDIALVLLFLLSYGLLLAPSPQYYKVKTVLQQQLFAISRLTHNNQSQTYFPDILTKDAFNPAHCCPISSVLSFLPLLFSVCSLLTFKGNARRAVFSHQVARQNLSDGVYSQVSSVNTSVVQ